MNSPKEDKRTGFILVWIGVIPVVWAALMAAPFLSECRFVKHVGRYSNEGKGWASNTVKGA